MEHKIELAPGYDCIKFECINNSKTCQPNSDGSHGRHGMTMRFMTIGDEGAVQFVLYTGWLPQHAIPDGIGGRFVKEWGHACMPADLGYHSKAPRYEGQEVAQESCVYCGGQPCYYNGSGLNANDAMYALVNGGEEALWQFMDEYYQCVFNSAEYPKPAEYKMPLR